MKFSPSSQARINTCDTRLQDVLELAIVDSPIDFGITCGHRDQIEQDRCCKAGLSKTPWPTSKHNASPSKAFDFVPFIEGKPAWEDPEAFRTVAHHILECSDRIGISLRWGGTWTGNADDPKAKFCDMPHMELR